MIKRKNDEEAILGLRALYRSYGYKPYKMSKFEEYDLYAANKSFLGGDNIVTVPGVGGRLMALRPDVTMSIVKNATAGAGDLEKLCYNETVYRTEGGELKEITQVGLECIGRVDIYAMSEVLLLAARSLALIDDEYLLSLSHMGIVSAILDAVLPASAAPALRDQLFGCIGEKNTHSLRTLCAANGISSDAAERLAALILLGGSYTEASEMLSALCAGIPAAEAAAAELAQIWEMLDLCGVSSHLRLDFSLVNDLQYYNGVIFKGFLRVLPTEILSGGRYDRLVERFGHEGGAIGFAVYLGLLERLTDASDEYDVDVLLTYDAGTDLTALTRAVRMLSEGGQSVRVQPAGTPVTLKYRQQLNINERGLEIGE